MEPRQRPVAGAARGPDTPHELFAEWIVAWLASVTSDELAGWIDSGVPMDVVIRRSVPGAGGIMPVAARLLMGRTQVEAAKAMGDRDFAALLDRVCDSLPDHALILALNKDWWMREIRRIRDAIVG